VTKLVMDDGIIAQESREALFEGAWGCSKYGVGILKISEAMVVHFIIVAGPKMQTSLVAAFVLAVFAP